MCYSGERGGPGLKIELFAFPVPERTPGFALP